LNVYAVVNDPFALPRHVWHPSGKYFFITQENDICVVKVADQEIVARLKGHTGIVRDLHFHPEKNLLASASYDGSVRIWDYQP